MQNVEVFFTRMKVTRGDVDLMSLRKDFISKAVRSCNFEYYTLTL
jgi:hypothetical protein